MLLDERLAGDVAHHVDELVDRDHLFGADVDRAEEVGLHQSAHGFNALIDVKEGPGLLAVAPDLDRPAVFGLSDLAGYCGRRLLLATRPGALRTEDVVETRDRKSVV